MGSTGHWPVPSGDPPLGTGTAPELFHMSVAGANVLPVPSGQWPDGTGGSPVLPFSTSEFGINRSFIGQSHANTDGKKSRISTPARVSPGTATAALKRLPGKLRGKTPPNQVLRVRKKSFEFF